MPDDVKPGWKGRPLTIASLLLLGSIVAGVVTFMFSAQGMVNEAATKAATATMERHTLPAVTKAHADLPEKLKEYTPRAEFRLMQKDLDQIKTGMGRINTALEKLSEQVQRSNSRRPRRSP